MYAEPRPTDAPRARRRRATTERIVAAATKLIVAEGFDGLSIHRLATALDYTPGALYRYFASKDALVAEVVVRIIDAVAADLAAAATATETGAPLSRVVAIARRWAAFAADDPNRFGLVALLLATPRHVLTAPEHTAPAIDAMLRAMRPLAEALAESAEIGALAAGDPVQRALLLFAGVQGVLLLKKQVRHVPELLDPDRLYADMLRALLAGWGATPAALDAATMNASPTPPSAPEAPR